MEQRFAFDEVAEQYLRARPGYPEALFEDLVACSGLGPGARILEIGCGPGNASARLADRGYRLTCLEPGPRLAELARRQLASHRDVRVVNETFESYPLPAQTFDLVMAAQSFHWVDPQLRCEKSARALAADGVLAVIANRPVMGTSRVEAAVQNIYETLVPEMSEQGDLLNTVDQFSDELRGSGAFPRIEAREYPWNMEYSTSDYLDLQNTHSNHQMLPELIRSQLLDAVGSAIDEHGGVFRMDRVAVLVMGFRS